MYQQTMFGLMDDDEKVLSSEDILENVKKLYQLFLAGAVKGPEKHEVNPGLPRGSRENYLYFTLPCCINFQRNSPALWQSALDTYQDPSTNYVFFPEKLVKKEKEEVQKDLAKHKLALQPNKHSSIWINICNTLASHYKSDPKEVLRENNFDISLIIQTLQKDKKHLFPYLGGIKLSNYWLFILSIFTDVEFKNIQEISIIPDVHVIRSTIKLGLAKEGVQPLEVEQIWRQVSKEIGISPVDMHSALWRWSRNNFYPKL
jgi:hypothetical protein